MHIYIYIYTLLFISSVFTLLHFDNGEYHLPFFSVSSYIFHRECRQFTNYVFFLHIMPSRRICNLLLPIKTHWLKECDMFGITYCFVWYMIICCQKEVAGFLTNLDLIKNALLLHTFIIIWMTSRLRCTLYILENYYPAIMIGLSDEASTLEAILSKF